MLAGIAGRAFVDLEPHVDTTGLAVLDDEICLALTHLATDYTGGCHRSMGIMPERFAREPWIDYGEAIAAMSDAELAIFLALSDSSEELDVSCRDDYTFGEDQEYPLSRRQMRYLEYKHGVYFPWKTYVELMPGGDWGTKADPANKRFTLEALRLFPRTIAYVKTFPFRHIGSVKLLGLASNDHGTVHRDRDPADGQPPDEFITINPGRRKRLFVWDDELGVSTHAPSRAYWFNDGDYHGVEADPHFRYSIRVDGAFTDDFRARLLR